MPYTNLSGELSPLAIQIIQEAVEATKEQMPFLITLTAQERQRIFKMRDKSLAFVENCLLAAKGNPDILPGTFDVVAYEKVVKLAFSLNEVASNVNQLASQVDDTLMAARSEAIHASVEVYHYVQAAQKKKPGLKAVAEQLSARFAKKAKQKNLSLPNTP
jgi:hypothetical protein